MEGFGVYVPGKSFIHGRDPRVKILASIFLSIVIMRAGLSVLVLHSLLMAGLVILSRLAVLRVISSLKPFLSFFAVIFVLHCLVWGESDTVHAVSGELLSTEGLIRALTVTWRFALMVIAAALFTMTTKPSELIAGIGRLLRPARAVGVPVQDVAMMMALALCFMPIFLDEWQRVRTAQMARGVDFRKGGLPGKVRTIGTLALPLLINSFRTAEETATAIEGRGYGAGEFTHLREFKLTAADCGALAAICIAAGLPLIAS